MKPTFVLIKTECCNPFLNSPCRIILQEVKDGELLPTREYLINPEDAVFYFTISGLDKEVLSNEKTLKEIWPEVESVISQYPLLLSSSDGRDVNVLYNALTLRNVDFKEMTYVPAKTFCRRGIDSLSYNFHWLLYQAGLEDVEDSDVTGIATQWSRLVCLAVESSEHNSLLEFCINNRIVEGYLRPGDFYKSYTKKRKRELPQVYDVEVVPDENCPFYASNVVFTGKLEYCTRNEAQKMVLAIGGYIQKSVTKETDYLVVGEQDLAVVGESGLSGKMKKADEYRVQGIPIEVITEKDFLEYMGRDESY